MEAIDGRVEEFFSQALQLDAFTLGVCRIWE